jgi:hypothetical protein
MSDFFSQIEEIGLRSRIVNPPLRRVTCRRAQDLIKCIGRGPDQKSAT